MDRKLLKSCRYVLIFELLFLSFRILKKKLEIMGEDLKNEISL